VFTLVPSPAATWSGDPIGQLTHTRRSNGAPDPDGAKTKRNLERKRKQKQQCISNVQSRRAGETRRKKGTGCQKGRVGEKAPDTIMGECEVEDQRVRRVVPVFSRQYDTRLVPLQQTGSSGRGRTSSLSLGA
jgi:hypothetical protein